MESPCELRVITGNFVVARRRPADILGATINVFREPLEHLGKILPSQFGHAFLTERLHLILDDVGN